MSGSLHRVVLGIAAVLFATAFAGDVAARGGGGGRGGGAGLSRGGIASGGSFSQSGSRSSGRANIARDRASSGDFGRYRDERLERRDDRQDHRDERREDWQEYADDRFHDDDYYYGYYDDGYDDAYYYEEEFVEEIYDRLPCVPLLKTRGGITYYQCRSDWYVRAYIEGDLVYVSVPPPTAR